MNDVIKAIEERRSINFFDTEKKVDSGKIKKMLELASLTPSSMNLQPWEVIVVESTEKKELLKKYSFKQPKITEAALDIIVIADPEAIEINIERVLQSWVELGYLKENMKENFRKNAFNLYKDKYSETRRLFAVKNTSFFAMSLMHAAKGLGLETHPMDGFQEDKIKLKFKIPDHKIIPVIIAVGHPSPDLDLLPRAWRRPVDEFARFV